MNAKNESTAAPEEPEKEQKELEVEEVTAERYYSESPFVAWTDIICDGVVWNITLREGITPGKIAEMFLNIKNAPVIADKAVGENTVYFIGKERRDYYPPQNPQAANEPPEKNAESDTPQQAPQPRPNGGSSAGGYTNHGVEWASGVAEFGRDPNAEDKYVHIVDRILISGTKDAPKVELFSHNPRLQYPVAKVPAGMMYGIIKNAYEIDKDDLAYLYDVGEEIGVQWIVTLIESPKNPKWRDLESVVIPSISPKTESEAEAHPPGPATAGDGDLERPLIVDANEFWAWVYKPLSVYTGISREKLRETADVALKQTDNDWQETAMLLFEQYHEPAGDDNQPPPINDNIPF